MLAAAQIGVGAAAIFARFALTGAGPIAVSAARLAIAAAVLLALRHALGETRARATRREEVLLVAAGLALAAHFATWIASLQYTAVAISTLLVSTTPVWTALYDWFARKRALGTISLIALAAGAGGLMLIAGANPAKPPVAGHERLGEALALSGAVAIAAYFVLVRNVRERFGTQAIVTRTYGVAAFALVFAAAAVAQPPPPLSATSAWAGIIAMAVVSQLFGHTALNAALRWFSASAVAFTTVFEPVTAGVLAFLVFGERLGWKATAGGALLLGAIALFLREEARAGSSKDEVPAL